MYGVAGNISPGYTLAIEEDILFETCAREAVLCNGFFSAEPPVQRREDCPGNENIVPRCAAPSCTHNAVLA